LYIGESILIPVELLKGSHYKILCKCDGIDCVVEKVIYKNYLKYDNKWENITVENVPKRRKETLKELWVDYPIQNKKVHQRMKKL
jgi:hypothetical protein